MRRRMPPALTPPRTISKPADAGGVPYRPWVEVSVLVRVVVPEWGVEEASWVHWAVPTAGGRVVPERAVPFDPGRRAATPGEPAEDLRAEGLELGEGDAATVCGAIAARWKPRLHFHRRMRLASKLDETLESFRRRCTALAAPALQGLDPARRGLEAARLLDGIASRELGSGELSALFWRASVAWYPSGTEPQGAPDDPMMLDSQGRRR